MILYLKNKGALTPDCSDYDKISFAEKYAVKGDVVKAIIAYLIMTDENPFSLSLERNYGVGTAESFAKKDIEELRLRFFDDHKEFSNYIPIRNNLSNEEKRIGKMIEAFVSRLQKCNDSNAFFLCVKEFYKERGVGVFGINKAFYMLDDGTLVPVSHIKEASFDDIYGYDIIDDDCVVLASDGMYTLFDEDTCLEILRRRNDLGDLCDYLVARGASDDSIDNSTVVISKIIPDKTGDTL